MKNKSGLAAEMAISAMLIVAALCMVLLAVTGLMQKDAAGDYTEILARAEVDQVGEDFVFAVAAGDFGEAEKTLFIENHGKFKENIEITFEEDGGAGNIFAIYVSHPNAEMSAAVKVRKRLDDVTGEYVTETISWEHGR